MPEVPARLKRLWTSVAGDRAVPHRPTVAASLIVALLAVGVVLGLVAVSQDHDSPVGTRLPGVTTSTPSTAAPPTNITLVPAAPSTTAGTTTTIAATTTTAGTSPPTGTEPCTPSELRVSASSNRPSYAPGQTVDVTTEVTDVVACTFDPEAPSGACPDAVVVEQSGAPVWPWPGQQEQCSPPAPTVLEPGQQESLTAAWNQQVRGAGGGGRQAPPGSYDVVGTWAWSGGPGQAPYQQQGSAGFVIG